MTPKDLPLITPSEWKIMKIVWERKSCVARDIYTVTKEKYGWAYGTTKAVMFHMLRKGHLKIQRVANCYIYSPAYPPIESLYKEGDALMDRAIEGTAAPLLSHMIKKGNLTPEEVQDLRNLLDEYNDSTEAD